MPVRRGFRSSTNVGKASNVSLDRAIDIGAVEVPSAAVDGDFNDDGVYDCETSNDHRQWKTRRRM